MDVLINELSLDGQYRDTNEFLDNLESMLVSIKLLEYLDINLLKNYTFFSSQITDNYIFLDIVKSKDNRIRKIKSFLLKLSSNPPYWNDDKTHSCDDEYLYLDKNLCDTSLAESSQRDKIILSFMHDDYIDEKFKIQKNKDNIDIYNIVKNDNFLDYLLFINEITPLNFCLHKYKYKNLNFSLLENDFGFEILNASQTREYLKSFDEFSNMSWIDIQQSDGLEYKKYNKPKSKIKGWFRKGAYSNTEIYKFRITQEYRCFGYREHDIFYVLRFEIDHKISDKG